MVLEKSLVRFFYYVRPSFEQTCTSFAKNAFAGLVFSLKLAGGFGRVTNKFYYVGEVVWPFIHCMNKREFPTSNFFYRID